MRSAACGPPSAVVTTAAAYQDESLCCPTSNHPSLKATAAAPAPSRSWHADRLRTYGSGQLMIGTELMLFFGLPSMTRSL